ncbi:MAG: DUF3089 domain-containing protein [Polyangiales bacterium]
MRSAFASIFVLVAVPLLGCSDGTGSGESRYADETLWLCRPGIAGDQCALADLSMTEIHANGTTVVSDGPASDPDASIDCFVVYETVDFNLSPGNTIDPSPTDGAVLEALGRNGARFRGTCRIYAPLYRQMTLGTYYEDDAWEASPFFETAYEDISDAFDYYMRNHNRGRDLVLIGHSQGAHVLTRLLEERFESDEALRGQLISALLIGAGGRVHVPRGELLGGNFEVIPLCSSAAETGCVIAFDSLAFRTPSALNGTAPKELPNGNEAACVNPASFGQGRAPLAIAAFARSSAWSPKQVADENVSTGWVSYPLAFNALCAGFLWIGVESENAPFTPFELQEYQTQALEARLGQPPLEGAGLHWSNFSLTNADLIRIVETQAATRE